MSSHTREGPSGTLQLEAANQGQTLPAPLARQPLGPSPGSHPCRLHVIACSTHPRGPASLPLEGHTPAPQGTQRPGHLWDPAVWPGRVSVHACALQEWHRPAGQGLPLETTVSIWWAGRLLRAPAAPCQVPPERSPDCPLGQISLRSQLRVLSQQPETCARTCARGTCGYGRKLEDGHGWETGEKVRPVASFPILVL